MKTKQRKRAAARFLPGLPLLAAVFFFSCGRPAQMPEPTAFADAPMQWSALTGDAARGKVAAKRYCIGCHVVDGEGHALSSAPSFAFSMQQPHINPDYLRHWLWNPPAVKPETVMPNLSLEAEEIEDLLAFLRNFRTEPVQGETVEPAAERAVPPAR